MEYRIIMYEKHNCYLVTRDQTTILQIIFSSWSRVVGPSDSFRSLRSKRKERLSDHPSEKEYTFNTLNIFIICLNHLTSITKRERGKACNLSTQKIADSQRTLSLRLPLRKCFQTIARLLLEIVGNETCNSGSRFSHAAYSRARVENYYRYTDTRSSTNYPDVQAR